MPFSMYKSIIDDALTVPRKYKNIIPLETAILSGGDPTCHPHLEDFIQYAHHHQLRVSVLTNGYNIEEYLPYLKPDNDTVQISLDGNEFMHDWNRGKGSFKLASEKAKLVVDSGVTLHVFFTLHEGNKYCVDEVMDIVKNDWNARSLTVNYYHAFDGILNPVPMEVFDELSKKADKVFQPHRDGTRCYTGNCIAGIHGCSILPDGTYWDCSRNQEVLGKFPEKFSEVVDFGRMENKNYHDPKTKCMRRGV